MRVDWRRPCLLTPHELDAGEHHLLAECVPTNHELCVLLGGSCLSRTKKDKGGCFTHSQLPPRGVLISYRGVCHI